MRLHTILALLLLAATLAPAQRLHHDPLTEAEADQMREVAQEPEKRIPLIVKFAKARLEAVDQLRGDPKKPANRAKKIHGLLEDFTEIMDELDDNLAMYGGHKDDISEALGGVLTADTDFRSRLEALKSGAQPDPASVQEAKEYGFAVQNALEAVDGSAKDAQDLLDEIARAKQDAKKAGKK